MPRLTGEAGWDGLFILDHLIGYNRDLVGEFAATNILLAAAALATTRIRLDAQVTPAPRRRPAWLARETATLDRLSGGRMVLGVGLGDPVDNEYGRFGDRPGRRSIRRGSIAAPKRRRARGVNVERPTGRTTLTPTSVGAP